MIIHLERSGGFTGIPVRTTVDTDHLDPPLDQELCDLLDASNFFELPEGNQDHGPGPDRFQYRLTVDGERGSHTVEFAEGQIPADLEALVRRLTALRRGG
jgi:hypothetical protein